ncbi:energy-coupling factor transporter transmembrane component T [Nocardioides sp. AE5]|uniref:energy-coupling factor transporter transmembrane component T family protein n=1 Tax=Nocardioides sp. AE5 TaxID=2962573 RepID=UPI0028816414|nr:energy-coupling factor transporter transmembrane component T [Nocardioides sp. AE5]MDT0202872.1 energy-coupling factor transporter transmembrane component T [Nocardioides sp. AE5]
MSSVVLGAYLPGNTWLHRCSPGPKLLALAAIAVHLVWFRSPALALGAVAGAGVLVVWTGMPLATALRVLRRIAIVAVLLGAWLVWQQSWARAVDSVGDLVALILLASVLTATTAVDDMLDTITRCLHPFRRLGVNPEKVSLAFSLTLRAIPTTIEIAEQTRDAAVARGLQRSPRARLVPMVIRAVAHARATGEALDARGIGDD